MQQHILMAPETNLKSFILSVPLNFLSSVKIVVVDQRKQATGIERKILSRSC